MAAGIGSFFKKFGKLLGESFKGFRDYRFTKLAGSLAFSTVFSMGPLLVVIISLCGLFLKQEAIEGEVQGVLGQFMGEDTASQLQDMIRNASLGDKSKTALIIGILTLFIGATTMFAEIQSSVNYIWGLKPKPKKGLWKFLRDRVLSFSVIISLGFLLLVSLVISGIIDAVLNQLRARYPDSTVVLFFIVNIVFTIGVSLLIFAVIFKVLPDAKIRWKDVFVGALVTALLFQLGKFGLSFYISKSNVGSTYGAAGSLVVMLVWVYISSIFLYLGANFTRLYALQYGGSIEATDFAVPTKEIELEDESGVIRK